MTDRTLGIIKAIKQSGKVWNRAVAEYMSELTGSPIEEYTETCVNQILQSAFLDYIGTCDHPAWEVQILFDLLERHGTASLGHHLAHILGIAQVRDHNGYAEDQDHG